MVMRVGRGGKAWQGRKRWVRDLGFEKRVISTFEWVLDHMV